MEEVEGGGSDGALVSDGAEEGADEGGLSGAEGAVEEDDVPGLPEVGAVLGEVGEVLFGEGQGLGEFDSEIMSGGFALGWGGRV